MSEEEVREQVRQAIKTGVAEGVDPDDLQAILDDAQDVVADLGTIDGGAL